MNKFTIDLKPLLSSKSWQGEVGEQTQNCYILFPKNSVTKSSSRDKLHYKLLHIALMS